MGWNINCMTYKPRNYGREDQKHLLGTDYWDINKGVKTKSNMMQFWAIDDERPSRINLKYQLQIAYPKQRSSEICNH